MPKNKDMLLQMLSGGVTKGLDIGADGAKQAMKAQADEQSAATKRQEAKSLFDMLKGSNPKSKIAVTGDGGMTVDPEAPLSANQMRPQLTPAQETYEKKAGQDLQTYNMAGGQPSLEKDMSALTEVQGDLDKRDWYDRSVGGLLNGMPSLMGLLAPTEKARRDKAQGTVASSIRKIDSNPTQELINSTMGRVYDPSSDNETNKARIAAHIEETRKRSAQMGQANQNFQQTGYASLGSAGRVAPKAPAGNSGMVTISKDGQVLEIPAADLASAQAEGWTQQ
jgi:hypothetical protein